VLVWLMGGTNHIRVVKKLLVCVNSGTDS